MGTVANAIDNKLRARFAPEQLNIHDDSERHRGHAGHREGGETHFKVEIVAAAFDGHNRVARQRLVYETLKDEFAAGLHALEVKALTPGEAAARG